MTKQKTHANIIQINGISYNAVTGLPVGSAPKAVAHSLNVTLAPPRMPAAPQPLTPNVKKPVMDVTRVPARHHKPHAVQSGKTLMRSGLPKPGASLKRTTKVSAPASSVQKHSPAPLIKPTIHSIDPNRLHRASKITKNPTVKRFSPASAGASAAAQHDKQAATKHYQAKANAAASSMPAKAKTDMFEQAIAHARSHEQPAPKVKTAKNVKSRRTNLASGVLAVTLLAGFVAYQNVTNVKLQIASSKAGFVAELPAKSPPGFKVADLSYQPGTVDMKFASNSDNRAFAITQKASGWDSQALREVYLSSAAGNDYQTVEAAGRTVFLYGDNATWVNGGVWYQVTTDGSLSSRQLIELAGSM